MSYRMKKICALLGCAILTISMSACSFSNKNNKQEESENLSSNSSITASRLSTAELFSDRDKEIGYQEESCITITLSDEGSQSSSDSVAITDSVITVTEEGTYLISGTLSDGQIIINADSSSKIQLILNNASISNSSSAAIYVKQADKVFVTTADGSDNHLSNSGEFKADGETNVDGVIFSKDDLTLNGAGTLTIETEYGHGVASKDELTITSGTYHITASSHALSGKDSVCISDGNFTLTSGKDGIHSENSEDTLKGYIYVSNGVFTLNCEGDGLDASNVLQVEGCEFNLTTIAKGLKSDIGVFLDGGTFNMDCTDDSIHSNGDVEITNGTYTIATEDDGVHAEQNLVISGGEMNITESYEGLESMNMAISGGNITILASDDGLNAAGGNDSSGFGGPKGGGDMFASDDNCNITLSGGTLNINSEGDGIDSNGNLIVTGGETYVCGPTNSGNGALDYAGSATVSGGTLVAIGMSGMALGISEESTQGTIFLNLSDTQNAGTITLTDSTRKDVLSYENAKNYNSVLVSCPDITEGSTYTLTTSGTANEIEMTSLIYGNSGNGGFGGGHGNFGGGMGGHGGFGGGQNDFGGDQDNFGGGGRDQGGMQRPDTTELPEDIQLPEGMEKPDGMQLPEDMEKPQNMPEPPSNMQPEDSPNS